LPEGIVIVNESDKVTADFASVEGALALSLDAVEEGIRAGEAFDDVAQRRVAGVALGQAKVEHGIDAEEDGPVAILAGRVLADVAVNYVVVRRSELSKQEEISLAERVGILADIRAES
jgi:hypothetical protein